MNYDRYAVASTSGWSIPDEDFEIEYVVLDRAGASNVVGSFIAATRIRNDDFQRLRLDAEWLAQRLARELNCRERGERFDAFVVDAAPRFLRLDGTD